MSKKPNVWISPRGDGWAVQREGSQRASVVTPTKAEAEKIGRGVAKEAGVELIVHKKDGTIGSKDSFGHDPNPPKDSEH